MPRYATDEIKETFARTFCMSLLQLHHYRCTQERESVAEVLESEKKAFTIAELKKQTGLAKKTIYRIIETFGKENLIHYSPSLKGYFVCQSLKGFRKRGYCHSYGACKKCNRINEFVHYKHAHPRLKWFKIEVQLHEWPGLCDTCAKTTSPSRAF